MYVHFTDEARNKSKIHELVCSRVIRVFSRFLLNLTSCHRLCLITVPSPEKNRNFSELYWKVMWFYLLICLTADIRVHVGQLLSRKNKDFHLFIN